MRPWLFLILMGTFYFEARAQAQSNPWLDTLAAIQSQTQEINCFLDDYRNEFGFDLNESAGRAQSELLALGEHPDPTQARNVLKRFFQSTRDIHTVPIFKTDSPYNATYLPFMIRSAGTGKYYITQISRKALPESAYPFQVSDQLISLGGKPIQEVVSELLPYVSAIDNRTYQQTQAEFSTTVNYDSFGQELKTGSVEIEVKRRFTGAVEKYSVNWITDAKATTAPASVVPAPLATPGPTPSSNLKNYSSTGNRDPFFSDLGNVIWHSAEADPFYAYISILPNGKKIGFVRVSTYFPPNIETVALPGFFDLVDRFVDAKISLLVYDHSHGGGGSLLYAYDIMSALIDQPADPGVKVQWTLGDTHREIGQTWKDIHDTAVLAKTDPEALKSLGQDFFVDKNIDQDFVDALIDESQAMLTSLADPKHGRLGPLIPFEGIKQINPNSRKHYTGPILVVTNELGGRLFSGFFKSMKRARFFGTPTEAASAYGTGVLAPDSNPFGLYYHFIPFGRFVDAEGKSMTFTPLKPNYRYRVTDYDLTHDMKGYRRALLAAVKRMAR